MQTQPKRNRSAFEIWYQFPHMPEARYGCGAETLENAEKRCATFRRNPRKYGKGVIWTVRPAVV